MSAHANIVHALLSTPELERRFVTSASFHAGVEAIAEVAETAVVGLVSVSDQVDEEVARRIWMAEHAPSMSVVDTTLDYRGPMRPWPRHDNNLDKLIDEGRS